MHDPGLAAVPNFATSVNDQLDTSRSLAGKPQLAVVSESRSGSDSARGTFRQGAETLAAYSFPCKRPVGA